MAVLGGGGARLERLAHLGRLARRALLLLDGRFVKLEHLLPLGLELARELGKLEDTLGALLALREGRDGSLRVDRELLQPRRLALAEPVHARLELLKVPGDRVPLALHGCVSRLALGSVGGELLLPVGDLVLQPLQLAHLRLDRARRLLVADGQALKVLRALLGRRHVV